MLFRGWLAQGRIFVCWVGVALWPAERTLLLCWLIGNSIQLFDGSSLCVRNFGIIWSASPIEENFSAFPLDEHPLRDFPRRFPFSPSVFVPVSCLLSPVGTNFPACRRAKRINNFILFLFSFHINTIYGLMDLWLLPFWSWFDCVSIVVIVRGTCVILVSGSFFAGMHIP